MILRTLHGFLFKTNRPPIKSKTVRPQQSPPKRFEIESLEGRFAANCPLGLEWTFDLDHGFFLNNVYASEGWHESVINLTVDSGCVDSITWVVPPSTPDHPVIFKDYIHTHDEGRVLWFTVPPGSPPIFGIGFYWGPVDETVTISATVTLDNGESKTKTATYDIDEPVLNGSTIYKGDVIVEGPPWFSPPRLALSGTGALNGVEYEANVHSDHSGEFFYIQLVNVVATADFPGGATCSRSTDGWRLDGGSDPQAHYPVPEATYATDANGDAAPKLHDTSNAPLFHNTGSGVVVAKKVTEVFMAHAWLMYESDDNSAGDGHRPVPVAHAEWGWSGTAVLKEVSPGVLEDGNDASDWEVRLPSSYANPLAATDTWPEWQRDSYYEDAAAGINYNWHCP